MSEVNLLGHPICFAEPKRLTRVSAWHQHIPFAMFLVDLLRPRILVELGTEYGDSYCAFCQAVRELSLSTRCYAVDTWQGDPHTGFYGPEVLADLRAHHDLLYGDFSRLVRRTFKDSLRHFADGTIDLLHIDGYHIYEQVKEDFATWLPKVSRRGVILLHDTNVREADFGVWRLWEQLKTRYPHFEFFHGHGLGLLAPGKLRNKKLQYLLNATEEEACRIRRFFFQLGHRIDQRVEAEGNKAQQEDTVRKFAQQVKALESQGSEREARMAALAERVQDLESRAAEREEQIVLLKDALTERSQETARLAEDKRRLEAELAKAEQGLQQLAEQVQALQGQATEREARMAALEGSMAERVRQAARLSEDNRRLQVQVADAEQMLRQLGEQMQALQDQATVREALIATLHTTLTEHNQQATRLAEENRTLETQVSSLEGEVASSHARVAERQDELASLTQKTDDLSNELSANKAQVTALLNSRSWRVTRPLRDTKAALLKAGRTLRRLPSWATQTLWLRPKGACGLQADGAEGLFYSVDSWQCKRGRFYGFGWAFDKARPTASIEVVVRTATGNHHYKAYFPTHRGDVAQAHAFANAQACGFWVSGKLPRAQVLELALEINFETGDKHRIPLPWNGQEEAKTGTEAAGLRADNSAGLQASPHFPVNQLLERLEPFQAATGVRPQTADLQRSLPPGVQDFLETARKSRTSGRKFVLVVDHNLGGGATQYRRTLVRGYHRKEQPVLLLRYDLPRLEYVLDYLGLATEAGFVLDSADELLRLAKKIGLEEIFVNNLYSYEEPLAMAALLPLLKQTSGATLTVAIHDYFPLCPTYTLLDDTGKFCGVPDLSRCEQCLPNNKGEFSFLLDQKDIKLWRETWRRCLQEATTLLCFSRSSVDLVRRAYPELDPSQFTVRPHTVDYLPAGKPRIDLDAELNIGVVGSINHHKGAGLVAGIAEAIRRRRLPVRITVIGTISPAPRSVTVTVTGPYRPEELPELIEKHRVNVFLFPSILSETFSYVVQELMQLEVPLAVYNIGAPSERVRGYSKGLILPEIDADKTLDALMAFHRGLRDHGRSPAMNGIPESKKSGEREAKRHPLPIGKIHAFTSAGVNYLPKVRLLSKSLKEHHPEIVLHLALADKVPGWLDVQEEPFDNLIPLESLAIPNRTCWVFTHTIMELCTAIKPFVLRELLDLKDCEQVFYFDPDVVLFSRIDELVETLRTASVVLTPHLTAPESTVEAILDNEICSLRHGVYNLGFLGVRNSEEGRRFATWWADRVYSFCPETLDEGLFTDQKWVDFVPIFFEGVRVVKSSRFNVAPWNITTRKLEGNFDKGFTVDGEPLAFYHFTGFDSGDHKVMAKKNAGDNPAVASLIAWYEKQNAAYRDEQIQSAPWAYATFENGEPITRTHRLIYRMRKDLQEAFPNPFEVKPGKGSYYDWFRGQAVREHPELVRPEPGAASVPSEKQASPNGHFQIVSKYQLREAVNALDFPRPGPLVRLSRFLLLTEHYWAWAVFHFKQGGLGSVLKRGQRRMQLMLGFNGAGSEEAAPTPTIQREKNREEPHP